MARDEYIHRELLNWARWKAGACMGGLGYGTVRWDQQVDDSGYREAVIPTIAIDAEHMDRAVATLDADLQATLDAVYVRALPEKMAAERLRVSVPTVKERVWRSHRRLVDALADVKAKAAAKRAHVDAMQRTAGRLSG